MKVDAQYLDDGIYAIPNGGTIKREKETLTPNGNRLGGRWAFRSENGALVDFDRYINDLAERHNINLYSDSNVCSDVIKQKN
jgi:hypothetical protein